MANSSSICYMIIIVHWEKLYRREKVLVLFYLKIRVGSKYMNTYVVINIENVSRKPKSESSVLFSEIIINK